MENTQTNLVGKCSWLGNKVPGQSQQSNSTQLTFKVNASMVGIKS